MPPDGGEKAGRKTPAFFYDVGAKLEVRKADKGDSPGRRREKEKRPEKGVILIDGR